MTMPSTEYTRRLRDTAQALIDLGKSHGLVDTKAVDHKWCAAQLVQIANSMEQKKADEIMRRQQIGAEIEELLHAKGVVGWGAALEVILDCYELQRRQ